MQKSRIWNLGKESYNKERATEVYKIELHALLSPS